MQPNTGINQPKFYNVVEEFKDCDFPSFSCKNRPFVEIYPKVNNFIQYILFRMFGKCVVLKKHQYVDIKVDQLKFKDKVGFWHLDSSLNPCDDYQNFLYVTGEGSRTEFVRTPLFIPPQTNKYVFSNIVENSEKETFQLPINTITEFDGRSIHRKAKTIKEKQRLLIRLINTDKILPSYYF